MFSKRSTSSEHPKDVCSVPLAWAEDFLTMKNQMLQMREFLVKTECDRSQFCEETGLELYLKKDFRQVTGSCHARSALCILLSLSTEQKKYGVITALEEEASPLCYFGKKLNIPVIVVLSKATPLSRIEVCKQFEDSNTTVLIQGDNPKEAEKIALELATSNNMHYSDDRARFIGYGSVGIEIFEQVPDLDVMVVPYDKNNKTLAQSILLVMNALKPTVQVVLAVYTPSKSSTKTFQSIQSDSSLSVLNSESDRNASIPKDLKQEPTSVSFQIGTPPSSASVSSDQIAVTSSSQQQTSTYTSICSTKSIPSPASVQETTSTKPFASSLSVSTSPTKSYSAPTLRKVTQEDTKKNYVDFNCIWLPVMNKLMHIAIGKLFEKERCVVDKSSAVSVAACFSNQQEKFKKKRVVSLLTSSNIDIIALPKYLERGLSIQGRLMLISVKIPSTPNCITDFYNRLTMLTMMNIFIKKIACQREKAIFNKYNVKIFILCETKILNQEQFEYFSNALKLGYPDIEITYNINKTIIK